MATYSSVKYGNIHDGSVVAADIQDGAVTAGKLQNTLDISGKTVTLPNTAVTNAMLAGSIDLTSKVTGALPIARGGVGVTSLGSAGQVVSGNSGGTALEFATASGGLLQTKHFRKTSGFVVGSPNDDQTLPAPFNGATTYGITPSATNSIIFCEFNCIVDHGDTWRSNKAWAEYSTNGGSSWTAFGMSTTSSYYPGGNFYGATFYISAAVPNQNTTNQHLIRIRQNGHNSGAGARFGGGTEGSDSWNSYSPQGTGACMTLLEYSGSVFTLSTTS